MNALSKGWSKREVKILALNARDELLTAPEKRTVFSTSRPKFAP
jgi:hypothetical protein